MSSLLKEFKTFATRGNVVDVAVGVTIGMVFGAMSKSLVDNIIMPPIGLVLGKVDFSNLFVVLKAGADGNSEFATVADAQKAGAVTINYGLFINSIISFIIIAFAMFLIVKLMNKLQAQKEDDPTHKDCPFCKSSIDVAATRCPQCTSQLES